MGWERGGKCMIKSSLIFFWWGGARDMQGKEERG